MARLIFMLAVCSALIPATTPSPKKKPPSPFMEEVDRRLHEVMQDATYSINTQLKLLTADLEHQETLRSSQRINQRLDKIESALSDITLRLQLGKVGKEPPHGLLD